MTCHGESCRQGRAVCTEGCNTPTAAPTPALTYRVADAQGTYEPCTPLIQEKHDWDRNEPYDSAAEIAARLPLLILCTVLGCIAFSVSAWMMLGDSGIAYALASLVRNLKFL
jgi:hypothetical protein